MVDDASLLAAHPEAIKAKGVGEISSISITPAITNAIYNAIYNVVGVRVRRLPVDQDTLLRAMKSGKKSVD
jgi:CO/xanthine dehydrogenase Mo-binding subunit